MSSEQAHFLSVFERITSCSTLGDMLFNYYADFFTFYGHNIFALLLTTAATDIFHSVCSDLLHVDLT